MNKEALLQDIKDRHCNVNGVSQSDLDRYCNVCNEKMPYDETFSYLTNAPGWYISVYKPYTLCPSCYKEQGIKRKEWVGGDRLDYKKTEEGPLFFVRIERREHYFKDPKMLIEFLEEMLEGCKLWVPSHIVRYLKWVKNEWRKKPR